MCSDSKLPPGQQEEQRKAEVDITLAALRLEWENFRYQDGLRWSRIQAIGIVEAAILTGTFAPAPQVTDLMRVAFVVLLSAMVVAIWLLGEKDGRDASEHLERARLLERLLGLPPLVRQSYLLPISGHLTLRASMMLLTVFNSLILLDVLYRTALNGSIEHLKILH